MEALVKKRGILRSGFTRLANGLREEFKKENAGKEAICSLFNSFEAKAKELEAYNREILNLMLEVQVPEDELLKENETADSYQKDYFLLKRYVNQYLSGSEDCEDVCGNALGSCKYDLLETEWRRFGGDLKDWMSFWSHFKKVDEDDQLDYSEKYQCLLQSTIEGSEARELVESFPPSPENYRKAVECMKSIYGREDLLIEEYIREIVDICLNKALKHDHLDLSILYDKLVTNLKALKALGVTSDKYASILYPLVEGALPPQILNTWKLSPSRNVIDFSSTTVGAYGLSPAPSCRSSSYRLAQLMLFLRKEVEDDGRIS